jgi:hypothetical protein
MRVADLYEARLSRRQLFEGGNHCVQAGTFRYKVFEYLRNIHGIFSPQVARGAPYG